jgi:predicted chitinase
MKIAQKGLYGGTMGDRFYTQQKESSYRQKSDMSIIENYPMLSKLTKDDLEKLPATLRLRLECLPEGRLKAPYIEQCSRINKDVQWSRMTVKELQEFLKVVSQSAA